MQPRLETVLDSFVGDYGPLRVSYIDERVAIGILKPIDPPPMSTLSYYRDSRRLAFVEGIFYDDFESHHVAVGESSGLARVVADSIQARGPGAIAGLSGSFAGCVVDLEAQTLLTFVDRLGTRSLYWRQGPNGVIVTSNLASLRHLGRPQLDVQSALQYVTIGFPVGERTLLKDVFVQPPASAHTYSAGPLRSVRYWTPPERRATLRLRMAAREIVEAMEDCVTRLSCRSNLSLGLGLTGGHDSRVVLSSLLYRGVPFKPVTRRDHDFNDRVAPALCRRAGLRFEFTGEWTSQDLRDVQNAAFVYTDGQFLHTYGPPLLGRECVLKNVGALMTGFGGDLISGFSPVPSHLHARGVAALVASTLASQMKLLTFHDAEALLIDAKPGTGAEAFEIWKVSFEREAWRSSLPDVSIWQRLQNKNFKDVFSTLNTASQYVPLLHPYADSGVLDTYFRLPLQYLNQTPHCYAGFYRFPAFGSLPACSFRMSLRAEARFPAVLHSLRVLVARGRPIRARLRRSMTRDRLTGVNQEAVLEVSKSPLFDSDHLQQLMTRRGLPSAVIRRLQTLSRFFSFYVSLNDEIVPRPFRRDAGS
jgi:hypothetical protein